MPDQMLPFTDGLMEVGKGDRACADLADRHYSRQSHGSRFFMPPGLTIVLRDSPGTVVFGWLKNVVPRMDGLKGILCTIFRNESGRLSSEIILEAESFAVARWGPCMAYTYIDSSAISSKNPGFCFKVAGWKRTGRSKSGKILLSKDLK